MFTRDGWRASHWTGSIEYVDGSGATAAELLADLRDKIANYDPLAKLRTLEADQVTNWKNFSDPEMKLAREYRINTLPQVLILDGERKIQYFGDPGSFAEITAEALLSEAK